MATLKVHVYDNQGKLIVYPGVAIIGSTDGLPTHIKFFNNTSNDMTVKVPVGLAEPVNETIAPKKFGMAHKHGRDDMAVVYSVTVGRRKGIGGSDPVIIIDT